MTAPGENALALDKNSSAYLSRSSVDGIPSESASLLSLQGVGREATRRKSLKAADCTHANVLVKRYKGSS
jgi:hypothetical protein